VLAKRSNDNLNAEGWTRGMLWIMTTINEVSMAFTSLAREKAKSYILKMGWSMLWNLMLIAVITRVPLVAGCPANARHGS
jgi:hypothetical protein